MTDLRATPEPLADDGDRELIRTALDDTIVVEAAAGTGKTTELVARIVRLIATGKAQIADIVAVTFTEKAAGELKLRIREELEKARSEGAVGAAAGTAGATAAARAALSASHAGSSSFYDEALARLEEAHVSTIHGFCADLLRERPVEASVDPGFEVLTEAQANRLFDRAFRGWFQQQLESPAEGVRRAVRRLPSAWSPYADDEDGPVERLRRAGLELLQWRDLRAAWRRDPFDRDAEVRRAIDELCAFADLTQHPSWDKDPLFESTRHLRERAADIRRAREEGSLDCDAWEAILVRLVSSGEFKDVRRRCGRKADYGGGLSRAQVLAAYDALADLLAAFARRADADLAVLLQQELLECVDAYNQMKAAAGALDFLDLLLKARDLVRDCAHVRRAFQQRFKYILVDEFQDTDPLQAEILLLLAAKESGESVTPDWRTIPIRDGALFVVGDPKQSIYRFRRADVGIYQEVCDLLVHRHGGRRVQLTTNFRSVPDIQRAVNAAFAPEMRRDDVTLQADYVPLSPLREPIALEEAGPAQPAVIVLPVPNPYGMRNIAMGPIEGSLPDAVGAWVDWLVRESGWRVTERRSGSAAEVPIEPRHVCILFRRFVKFGTDVTRAYVDALEARGVAHLLVGGRSFHDREEVETLRSALAAIEWPEDALSVYATLRGALFSIGEEALVEYWHLHPRHRFHPYDIPDSLPPRLQPVRDALAFLRELHARRNHRPAADTIGRLLEHTRAHVTFVMRPAGERVLANVLQVVELARQYEADDGISFRGFVDALREAAERSESAEAPVVEEGSDGVRLMTVHKAKGLEFPVVILADMTCRLSRSDAARHVDQAHGLCAMQLMGCAPADLLDHEPEEIERDKAEGVRLAYVAATRARDVLVVPAIGDSEFDGWVTPLNKAIYPPASTRRDAQTAPGCPSFRQDTVRKRPDGDPARGDTVRPGLHKMGSDTIFSVVWWDPTVLALDAEAPVGLRREDLIARSVADNVVADGRAAYDAWAHDRLIAVDAGSRPSVRIRTITEFAHAGVEAVGVEPMPSVELVQVPREGRRPGGRRFGTLVHAVLATAPLDADANTLEGLATLEARILGAPVEEAAAAADLAARVLTHPLLADARAAHANGRCRREVPVTLTLDDGRLLEGVIDLAYEHEGMWRVIDFKSDEDPTREIDAYRRQVGLYAAALAQVSGGPVQAYICAV
jgi:ATP-dependent exoDNAse (exonuclease V) beta subunit